MGVAQRITPCLWFDHQAEEAARFYVSIFKNSKIVSVARYSAAGQEIHRRPPGSMRTVEYELDGERNRTRGGRVTKGRPEGRPLHAAVFIGHDDVPVTGSNQPPSGTTVLLISPGPHVPASYSYTGVASSRMGSTMRHASST